MVKSPDKVTEILTYLKHHGKPNLVDALRICHEDDDNDDVVENSESSLTCAEDEVNTVPEFEQCEYCWTAVTDAKAAKKVEIFSRRIPPTHIGVSLVWMFMKNEFRLREENAIDIDPDSLVYHLYLGGCRPNATNLTQLMPFINPLVQLMHIFKQKTLADRKLENSFVNSLAKHCTLINSAMIQCNEQSRCLLANTGECTFEERMLVDMRLYANMM